MEARKVVREVTAEKRERPWWQAGPDSAFRARIRSMPLNELEAASGEMKGAIAYIESQIVTRADERGELLSSGLNETELDQVYAAIKAHDSIVRRVRQP